MHAFTTVTEIAAWIGIMIAVISASGYSQEDPSSKVEGELAAASFNEYWYGKGAEISRYELTQARYGELHKGHAVMIFVNERFDTKKQVKSDNPTPENSIDLLKLNFIRKFNTGIYPYSTMVSVFSPIDIMQYPLPIKMTTSVQEWCGNIFMQMNLRERNYDVNSYSYFEETGDESFTLGNTISEDAFWNMIRFDYRQLPVGKFEVIPNSMFVRLKHIPLKAYTASALLRSLPSSTSKSLMEYQITIPKLEKTLSIQFEKEFPYRIESWQETYLSGWGDDAKVLTTTANRTHTLNEPYWEKHDVKDVVLRKLLGLP